MHAAPTIFQDIYGRRQPGTRPWPAVVCAVLLAGSACDRIPQDMIVKNDAHIIVDDTTSFPRKIMLEYFTGHYCGNCPSASKPAFDEIERLYGHRVVVMVIHAGAFAMPALLPDNLDLRSEAGNRLYDEAGITSVPAGVVNRVAYNGTLSISPTAWSTVVGERINSGSRFAIAIDTALMADAATGSATVTVSVKNRAAGQQEFCGWLVEDSIVGYQLDYYTTQYSDQKIPDYVFHDVLRLQIIPAEGAGLSDSLLALSGNAVTRILGFTINESWVMRHCSLAFTIADAASGEILQCEKAVIVR